MLPKDTVIATDGEHEWRAPHDDCVLVMPSLAQLRPGTTMVRLTHSCPVCPLQRGVLKRSSRVRQVRLGRFVHDLPVEKSAETRSTLSRM